jgi:ATP-dependent Clp protease ATP-binding subunit ClpX
MESIMLDIMYTLPSTKDVTECVINKAVVEEGKEPLLLFKPEAKSA